MRRGRVHRVASRAQRPFVQMSFPNAESVIVNSGCNYLHFNMSVLVMPSATSVSQSHDARFNLLPLRLPASSWSRRRCAPSNMGRQSESATNDNGRRPRTDASHRPALMAVAVASESGIQVRKGCLKPLIVVHKARPARRAEHPQAR